VLLLYDPLQVVWGCEMATNAQIEARVLAFFRAKWRNIDKKTVMRDLPLDDRQILDIGTHLVMELGCDPSRRQILECNTVGDLITLLQNTKFVASHAAIRSLQ
jgi:acyl carrier protein